MQLYYFPTPNGRKVSIALEEMGLAYDVVLIDILQGEQSAPGFLEISPNGRIPGLVDADAQTGERIVIFESGAILQYLGRKSGLYYPTHSEARRASVDAWLFWQMAGLGPMTGQITFFTRASQAPGRDPEASAFAIKRFTKEVRRLYGVLDKQLAGKDYICGEYSIADMASWPWIDQHGDYVGLDDFPNMRRWHERIAARPAVQRALKLGHPLPGKQEG